MYTLLNSHEMLLTEALFTEHSDGNLLLMLKAISCQKDFQYGKHTKLITVIPRIIAI